MDPFDAAESFLESYQSWHSTISGLTAGFQKSLERYWSTPGLAHPLAMATGAMRGPCSIVPDANTVDDCTIGQLPV